MKWHQFLTALGVLCVLGAEPAPADKPPQTKRWEEPENPRVKISLLVQVALQQGRECLANRDHAGAIRILEAHLPKINGDAVYLQVLEQAYRGHVKELQQKGEDPSAQALAQRYLQKLAVFDPGVVVTESVKHADSDSRSPTVQSSMADGDASELLTRAESAFQAHRFQEAAQLYQRAHAARAALTPELKDHWAYCKLHWVTEQINSNAGADWTALEREVRTALSLATSRTEGHKAGLHECGANLLESIESRSRRAALPRSGFDVRRHRQSVNGWQVTESANFRILSHDVEPADLGEPAAQVAEQTRAAVLLKWLGERGPAPWPCKCDIYLHATGEAYAKATGVPADSPGHSSIGAERHDASRITSLRIDLHVDNPNLLSAVLPHETTHVTLAGRFGPRPLPRWADEGLAVLSEPYDKINRHLRALPQVYQEGRAFTAGQLMNQEDYPGTNQLTAFYGQSVALVYHLTEVKGARVFGEFLRSAQREGYEPALRRHYGFRDFRELEKQWQPQAASGKEIGPTLARGQQ